jgi:oligopeptide transport system substrate-binding protein
MRALLFAGAAAALALTACGPSTPQRPPCPPGKLCLHTGNVNDPISLDPPLTQGTWESRILADMIIGLTEGDAEGRPVPGMAESWTTSPDGLVWTFKLRDAKWSDGVEVTADDFVYGLRRTLNPETASEYAYLLYFIAGAQAVNEGKAGPEALGVRALGPKLLEMRLLHPAPYLPEILNHQTTFPVPKHVVEKLGKDWTRPGNYVSNGAYVLQEWKLGDRIRVKKNPYFYDAQNVCFDEISYYPTRDAISAERRVRRGELDVNMEIQSNRIAYLRQPDQMPRHVRVHTYIGTTYLAFNTRDVPALKDKRVRQALAMAIDRDFITRKLMRGGQTPAYTMVPPGTANHKQGAQPYWAGWPLEQRQAQARKLLAEAGYGPGKRPLALEIKHRSSADPTLWTPAVQADWKAIGVRATLIANEGQIAYTAYRMRDFQVADAAWIGDYNDPKSFLDLQQSSTGAQNYGDYNNPAYDALLAKADLEPDAAKRAEYLKQAEQMMIEDAPIAPLYFLVNKNLVSPNITGWVDNLVDQHRSRYLCVAGRTPAGQSAPQ